MNVVAAEPIARIASARDLPANVEAEAALIGAILGSDELALAILPNLKADDFHEPVHQRVIQTCIERRAEGKSTNPVLLKPYFKDDEALAELGGLAYLARLTGDTSAQFAPLEFVREVVELAERRRLITAARSIIDAAHDTSAPLAEMRQLAGNALVESAPHIGPRYDLLDADELEAMPAPEWLVRDLIPEGGLAIIYGDPGAGKSFLALDMALRIARGDDWHGVPTRQTGVLYIAGEGARGIGKRVAGWRMSHGLKRIDAPFLLLPTAVQLLDEAERARLLKTIDEAKERAGFTIGLTFVDTVSRSISGRDENKQETMSAFVRALDEVKNHAGGAAIGVHHSGKDKDRGMRGSSVLLGAVDTAIRVTKSERLVTAKVEKQKDAEEGKPIYFELEHYKWQGGNSDVPGQELTTLVPRRTDAKTEAAGITSEQIHAAFGLLTDAWVSGRPLSHRAETKKDGRFAPAILRSRIGGDADAWEVLIRSWLENDCLAFEVFDKGTKRKGLRVLNPL